jgi:lipoic acid synthetase
MATRRFRVSFRARVTNLRQNGGQQSVDILTLGQYLRPSADHLPIARYYAPEEFAELRDLGLAMGFRHVEAGPLVRSSYHAWEQVERATAPA